MTTALRRSVRSVITLAVLALLLIGNGRAGASRTAAGPVPATASAAATLPRLVAVRAAHRPGYDRVVFDFTGPLPTHRVVRYVSRLVADPRGTAIPVAGRAILAVRFTGATGHTENGRSTAPARVVFPLPNVMAAVCSGDFEAVLSYGITLAQRASFHVLTLTHPSRVAIDISTRFPTVLRRVYFFNQRRFVANTEPFVTAVLRPIPSAAPATALMDRLFTGPTTAEQRLGLRFRASGASGFSGLSIASGVARIRLTGGCASGGSTATIAEQIMRTLRGLPGVHWVKIYDPSGRTEAPGGARDSIPTCLEP